MNEELTLAIDELRQRPTHRGVVHSGEAGETLRSIQWVDLYADWTAGNGAGTVWVVPGSETIPRLIA